MKANIISALRTLMGLLKILYIGLSVRLRRASVTKIIFIFGIPNHNNIGDLAIAKAQVEFIKMRLNNKVAVSIPYWILHNNLSFLERIVKHDDIIVGLGGGNMGEIYFYEENLRREFIKAFPNNDIIVFPQTIHFSSTKVGNKELEKTRAIYSKHKSLTIVAREKVSYRMMKRVFPFNNILLTPDIVLSMNKSNIISKRSGVICCIRSDVESKLSVEDKSLIFKTLHKKYKKVTTTDTIASGWLYKFKPNNIIISRKLSEFRHAEIIVTDRLHGMVFAAITGTPCVALTNYNHKVMGTYKWIRCLEYITYINSPDRLKFALNSIDISKTYTYDPYLFEKQWDKIALAMGGKKDRE